MTCFARVFYLAAAVELGKNSHRDLIQWCVVRGFAYDGSVRERLTKCKPPSAPGYGAVRARPADR